jgi:hypothetical protein
VRVWRESGANSEWRSQIQYVSTGEVVAFQGIPALFEYIEKRLDQYENPSDRNPKSGLR